MNAAQVMAEFGESFVHRRVGRAIGGFFTGGPVGAVTGLFTGDRGGGPAVIAEPLPPETRSPAGCPTGFTRDPISGVCLAVGSPAFESAVGRPTDAFGAAVVGQFGAGLQPAVSTRTMLMCPPGAVLGKDELCYNRGSITNKQRKWPRGRAPLLTGGERNAISKAAAAARKIQRTTKQLEKLGMLKKATPRRLRAAPVQRQIAAPADQTIVVG